MKSFEVVQSDERMKKGLDLLERKHITRQVGSGIYYGFVEFVYMSNVFSRIIALFWSKLIAIVLFISKAM